MKASLLAATLFGAALLATSNDAHAAGHAQGFGDKGQLILSADRLVPLFSYTHSSVSDPNANNAGQTRELSSNQSGISLLFGRGLSDGGGTGAIDVHMIPRVAFDFTPINHLTLGLGLAFAFGLGGSDKTERVVSPTTTNTTKVDTGTSTAIGVAPRVGYVLPIGEHFAFWPRVGFAFYSVSSSSDSLDGTARTTRTDTTFSLDLDPQFVIIPVEHFFFTVGPLLSIPLTGNRATESGPVNGNRSGENDADTTLLHFGINASIGGWIDLF